MEKIRLNVIGLSYNPTQNGASALLLGEDDGPMRIPIIIGEAEAQAIITRFEGFTPRRPLTHDLIVSMLHRFGLTAIEVFIYKFDDGIFYCTLTLSDGNITSEIESRVSDAVAIALRTKTPIFTTREVIDQTGIILPSNQDNDDNNIDQSTNEHDVDSSIKRLQQQLENLIIDENYEEAARVKDEIARLKSSSPGDKTISDNDDDLPSLSDLIL
ncbi:MAG: bifunctional nuclease family protein [Muribaculaceae bacterium]|nr:bifunctional nuclease family protein [Muribaculaceae bacterium]